MSLKALKAEIQRAATEVHERFDNPLHVLLVGIISSRRGDGPMPCSGWNCEYHLAGSRRQLFFPGTEGDAELMARALIDHAYGIEQPEGVRPAAVLIQHTTAPDDALIVVQAPPGISPGEHAARAYDALRSLN